MSDLLRKVMLALGDDVPWYRFWNPMSDWRGGIILALVFWAVVGACFWIRFHVKLIVY